MPKFNFLELLRAEVLQVESPALLDERLELARGTYSAWEHAAWPSPSERGERLIQLRPRILAMALAARELACLPEVIAFAGGEIQGILRGRGTIDDRTADATFRRRQRERVPALEEMQFRAYGRVLWLDDQDGQRHVYRIGFANEGCSKLQVLSRFSPLAQLLVTLRVGDKSPAPGGRRLEVIGNAFLRRYEDGYGDHATDFAGMELQLQELENVLRLRGLAATVAAERLALAEDLGAAALLEAEAAGTAEPEVGVQGLRSEFYVRTTVEQEDIVASRGTGLVVVLGVAGSGKTSVALGRAKGLCDRRDEDPEGFYTPQGARGFVLSRQLASYLEKARDDLSLSRMHVEEFGDLRRSQRIRNDFLETDARTSKPRFSLAPESPSATEAPEGRLDWLRAVDRSASVVVAGLLRTMFVDVPKERPGATKPEPLPQPQVESLAAIWSILDGSARAEADLLAAAKSDRPFRLQGLGARLDALQADVVSRLSTAAAWQGGGNALRRDAVSKSVVARLERLVRFSSIYSAALAEPSFGTKADGVMALDPEAVVAARKRVATQQTLTDADLDVIMALQVLAGADTRPRVAAPFVALPDHASQIFIDEFQDFSEVQLYVMGGLADPARRTITLVGDYCQQLTPGQRVDLAACFPRATTEELAPVMLWDNQRQSEHLARFAQRFREAVLMAKAPPKPGRPRPGKRPRLVKVESPAAAREALLGEIDRIPNVALTAVICPDLASAQALEGGLAPDLRTRGRESAVSRHGQLATAGILHFTTPLECKGLDFDAVVVPDIGAWDLTKVEQAHAVYVAISRPRELLSIVASAAPSPPLADLLDDGLVELESN